MSKRKRQSDGPTLAMVRPCMIPVGSPYYSEVDRGSILGKRPSIDDVFSSDKRFRGEFLEELQPMGSSSSSSSSSFSEVPLSLKRPAEFDTEIARLSKRLKATVPSAEEAIAFLLPHIKNLRQLYIQERQSRQVFEKKVEMLEKNNEAIKTALRDQLLQKSYVQRQLDLALYRLAMTDSGKNNQYPQNRF